LGCELWWSKEPCRPIRWIQIAMGRGNFAGKGMPRHFRHSAVSCATRAQHCCRDARPFGPIDMGRQVRALCPFPWATWASNTMSSGPTSVSSGILIHPTVWPQYTNVIQTGQTGRRSRSIGRTVICSGRPKTAEPTCRLVSGVEWAEAKRRRCGLMSNYFDHLLLFDVKRLRL